MIGVRRPADQTLEWHRAGTNAAGSFVVRAWAPKLNPGDTFPPYYEIEPVQRNQSVRRTALVQCKSCGGERTTLPASDNLAIAKVDAQRDYDKRLSEQSSAAALTYPS